MFATPNSGSVRRFAPVSRARQLGQICWLGLAGILLCCTVAVGAAETNLIFTNAPAVKASASERADKKLREARVRFVADQNNATNAWLLGQAVFEWNELAKDLHQQEALAREGIAACRQAVALAPKLAEPHYYLGLTLGQFADTKRNMAALKLVKEMEREFLATRDLDEHFDFAGADRNLGLLYHQAPTLISIGSRYKARQHLQRAVELAPDFPENRLNLIETLLEWGENDDARRELKALEKPWTTAQKNLTGVEWETAWPEWQLRLDAAKKKIPVSAK
jgi:tetratricopeptide (TPR) repeat protein